MVENRLHGLLRPERNAALLQELRDALARQRGIDLRRAALCADRRGRAADHLVHHDRAGELARVEKPQERIEPPTLLGGDDHTSPRHNDGCPFAKHYFHLLEEICLCNRIDHTLPFESLHVNRRHRSRRTHMLARPATNALLPVDDREALHDVNRLHGTLPGARRARVTLRRADAEILLPNRLAHVHVRTLDDLKLPDGELRTDLPALDARTEAVAVAEIHHRLPEGLQIRRLHKALPGAVRDAELATHAFPVKRLAITRARRQYGRPTVRYARKRHLREPTVRQLVRHGQHRHALQRLPPRNFRTFPIFTFHHPTIFTLTYFHIPTFLLASSKTLSAMLTPLPHLVLAGRQLRHQVEDRPVRTHPVAPPAPVADCCQDDDNREHGDARPPQCDRLSEHRNRHDHRRRSHATADPQRDARAHDRPADDPLRLRLGQPRAHAADMRLRMENPVDEALDDAERTDRLAEEAPEEKRRKRPPQDSLRLQRHPTHRPSGEGREDHRQHQNPYAQFNDFQHRTLNLEL